MESDFPKTADSFRTETRPYPIGCPIRYNTVQSVLKKEKKKAQLLWINSSRL